MSVIIQHPTDPSITYTSGKRGIQFYPQWVRDMLVINPDLFPTKEVVAKVEGATIVHPHDSTITYTYGKRGKKPLWVIAVETNQPVPIRAEKKFIPKEDENIIHYWMWNDQDGKITTSCIVGAYNEQEAMRFLNATFKTPVFQTEFDTCWKELEPDHVALNNKTGVFVKNKANEWIARPIINKAYVTGTTSLTSG